MSNPTEVKASIGSTLDLKNTYQFDTLNRLTDIVQQGQSGGNSVTAKHITQSYNALSQRTQIARYQSTVKCPHFRSMCYASNVWVRDMGSLCCWS
ncbi:MAG: hypothetical protein WCI02_02020 [Planctomycetota bacterium]